MMHNAIARLILWGQKSGVALEPVELSGGVTAARLAADSGDPARVALLHHISASRGAYEYERRGASLYVYAAADYAAIQRRGARLRAASDLFFAARRPDVYAADLPGYRAAAAALGLDPDACAAVGVDAVPVC